MLQLEGLFFSHESYSPSQLQYEVRGVEPQNVNSPEIQTLTFQVNKHQP